MLTKEFIQQVEKIILEAGSRVLKGFNKKKIVKKKEGNELYTQLDLSTEKYLIKNFKKLLPNCNFISEETNNKKEIDNKNFTWIIDPIDGTNNFIKSPTSPDFNGINSDDDSIKKHCNIGGLMNGSGICYTERDYQGCFIECKTRKVNGDCAIESELGQPNPSNYTNVFGSTISVQKHAHKHPGPHPHK